MGAPCADLPADRYDSQELSSSGVPMRRSLAFVIFALATAAVAIAVAQQQPNPRQPAGATVMVYAPEQHDLYDGHFVLSANRIYMVGGLNDAPGWDHMDNAAATLRQASGAV